MTSPMRKYHPIFKLMNNALIDLPAPLNISAWWNFGSLLGMCLMIQLLTGIILAMHYNPHMDLAFSSVSHICRDMNFGWLMRVIHANGGSVFFMCLYCHIGRGMYYGSFNLIMTWNSGILILVATMATAFLGYVLPWGQMSFWGATVITNLFSAIPYLGSNIVYWLWGGFSVDNATLVRFFAFHFTLPFIITMIVMIHMLLLHQTGSNNPLGLISHSDKIPFHPYFTLKDLVGFAVALLLLLLLSLLNPYLLSDPDNFIPANPLVTPVHIQPEWYFLFAYAILRSIPNKLGGVIALAMSIFILLFLPLYKTQFPSMTFYPLNQILFWVLIVTFILLTWAGAQPIEEPFYTSAQILTLLYFLIFILHPSCFFLWDILLEN